jgi:hypothetical protein
MLGLLEMLTAENRKQKKFIACRLRTMVLHIPAAEDVKVASERKM